MMKTDERTESLQQVPAQTTTLKGVAGLVPGPEEAAEKALGRGDSLDRYVVLGCVGTGGMGVVYAAYDPDLDRKVAIKLLRPRLSSSPSGEAARRRVLREAQALARLSQSNLVAVYHTGVFGDQVFIAMEFVTGRNLRDWVAEETRTWREPA